MNELEQKKQILEDTWQTLLEQVEVSDPTFRRPNGPPCYPFSDRLQRCIIQSDLLAKDLASEFGCSIDYIRAIHFTKNRRRLGC